MTSNGTANGTVNGVANGHTELANGEAGKILDGTEKINKLPKEPGKLLLELAWIIFIAFPMILLAFVKKFLPPQKKSLGGETVLVSPLSIASFNYLRTPHKSSLKPLYGM